MILNAKQCVAIEKLKHLKCGALFMEMGTGKTHVAVGLLNAQKNKVDYCIWIAPASLLRDKSYKDEIKYSDPLVTILYYSIESIGSSNVKFIEMLNIARNNRVFCIVDESITIKNTEAGRTKRLLTYYSYFDFRLILNGTPLTQGLIDLYSQIQFLSPKILNMTERQFANNFLTYKKEGYKPWKRWSKPENEAALIEIIRPYIFDAALDIPVTLREENYYFALSDAESLTYESEKAAFLENKYFVDFFSVAQKFQHIYTKCEDKYRKLKKIVDKSNKVIIYVKFLDEIERLRYMFDCVVLTGEEKGDLEKFKNESKVLLCTYGVGSLGLNLQYANCIVFFTQTFDYKNKIQAAHRIYRIGQKNECVIHNFWVETGLERIIEKSLIKKENTLSNVKRIISAEEAMKL